MLLTYPTHHGMIAGDPVNYTKTFYTVGSKRLFTLKSGMKYGDTPVVDESCLKNKHRLQNTLCFVYLYIAETGFLVFTQSLFLHRKALTNRTSFGWAAAQDLEGFKAL